MQFWTAVGSEHTPCSAVWPISEQTHSFLTARGSKKKKWPRPNQISNMPISSICITKLFLCLQKTELKYITAFNLHCSQTWVILIPTLSETSSLFLDIHHLHTDDYLNINTKPKYIRWNTQTSHLSYNRQALPTQVKTLCSIYHNAYEQVTAFRTLTLVSLKHAVNQAISPAVTHWLSHGCCTGAYEGFQSVVLNF